MPPDCGCWSWFITDIAPILRRTVYRKGPGPFSWGLAPYTGRVRDDRARRALRRLAHRPGRCRHTRRARSNSAGGRSSASRCCRTSPARRRLRPPCWWRSPRRRRCAGGAWLRLRRALTVNRAVALALCALFVAGLAAQQRLGARLQSDGFFYFAFLRSMVNDHDVNLANDYGLIGIGGEAIMTPTSTGYAQTAWSVGPAIAWMPFYAIGHAGASYLASRGVQVAVDGSSYPYRQAICRRRPVLRTPGLLVLLPARGAALLQRSRHPLDRGPRARLIHALVRRERADHVARDVDVRGGRVHLRVGPHARPAGGLAMGGAGAARRPHAGHPLAEPRLHGVSGLGASSRRSPRAPARGNGAHRCCTARCSAPARSSRSCRSWSPGTPSTDRLSRSLPSRRRCCG